MALPPSAPVISINRSASVDLPGGEPGVGGDYCEGWTAVRQEEEDMGKGLQGYCGRLDRLGAIGPGWYGKVNTV